MDRRRSISMAGATILLALGAGQYMASGAANSTSALLPVAASVASPLRIAAATPLAEAAAQMTPAAATPDQAISAQTALHTGTVPADCPATLDLFTGAEATLSVTLMAPCAPNQTLVLRHAGMAVTFQTTASGAFFTDIPALDAAGAVTIRFPDGQEVSAASPVPEIALVNRLVVQATAEDRFTLQGDLPIIVLGDPVGPVPLFAEVASWPKGEAPPLSIEAEVTPATCGRDLLGEVLLSESGKITRADLTLAMPDCDGIGGFVALNNPLPDMKLAATE